jgi:SAM-dependent methyltransferase
MGTKVDGLVGLRGLTVPPCRHCGGTRLRSVVDLGVSPLCERFLHADQLGEMERFYPLHVRACEECGLVQLPAHVPPEEIFTPDYPYHSAYSTSWVAHSKGYVEAMIRRLGLDTTSRVVEIASNDGYLLQHFMPHGIPVLGIDPAVEAAAEAEARGVPTLSAFFGEATARGVVETYGRADLVIANNVLAHVPDIDDFVAGIECLLAPGGTVTFEFPHLMRLLESVEYDTIYHEHYSYLSLRVVVSILGKAGLAVVDVEELPSHGGSLRVIGQREPATSSAAVEELLLRETEHGVDPDATFARFRAAVADSRASLLRLLLSAREDGQTVMGYGAPGKANTLLNYCGIRTDLIESLVDRNPHKHGMFTPGTRLPIFPPNRIDEVRPDLILILPWNLAGEISSQLAYTAEWGAKLAVAVPTTAVFEPGSLPATHQISNREPGPVTQLTHA